MVGLFFDVYPLEIERGTKMKAPINSGGARAIFMGTALTLALTAFPVSKAFAINETEICPEDTVEDTFFSEELPEDEAAFQADSSTVDESEWECAFTPNRNSTLIDIANASFGDLYNKGVADEVKITGSFYYKGQLTRETSQSFSLSDYNGSAFVFDAQNYGKVSVAVEYSLHGTPVKSYDAVDVAVTADTYNISPVSATLPVTFFSLNLWGENCIRSTGPVIAMLERANSFDWNNLPQPAGDLYGMYGLPYLTQGEISYQPGDFDKASDLFRKHADIVADYVHDLMELDPSSHINLYCVDYYAGLIQRVIYANKIPDSQYKIVLMSDGSYSYNEFTSSYNSKDNSAKNSQLISAWNTAKADAYKNGTVDSDFLNWDYANDFLWALVDTEPNAQWWVARKDLIQSQGDDNSFGKQVQSNDKVVQVNISNLLKTNIQPSEQNTDEFKALYNFNDGYFKAAEENGKDVMMFLGTRVTSEQSFSEYARFAQLYYGDS